MTQATPTQELCATDLHGYEWRFKHIFRGKISKIVGLYIRLRGGGSARVYLMISLESTLMICHVKNITRRTDASKIVGKG